MGASRHGGKCSLEMLRSALCAANVVKSLSRRNIYALFRENVSFWGLCFRPPTGALPLDPWGTSVIQTPSFPSPEKNPARVHDLTTTKRAYNL